MTAVIALVATAGAEESTLRRAGDAAHGRPAETRPNRSPPPAVEPRTPQADRHASPASSAAAADHESDSGFGSFITAGLYLAFGSGDDHPRGSYAAARWPYADGHPGGLVHLPSEPDEPGWPARMSRLALRLGVDAARIEDDLSRIGLDLRLELPLRFALEIRGSRYHESLVGDDADLDSWALAATWRLLQFRNLALRVGGGALGLHDDVGNEHGAEVIAALDVQPVAPLVFSARVSTGAIGSASRRELRIEGGAIWNRIEAVVGWECVTIEEVRLDGPFLALRTWL